MPYSSSQFRTLTFFDGLLWLRGYAAYRRNNIPDVLYEKKQKFWFTEMRLRELSQEREETRFMGKEWRK